MRLPPPTREQHATAVLGPSIDREPVPHPRLPIVDSLSRTWVQRTVLPALLFLAALASSALRSHAGLVRTQTIPLRTGWNAVFLEVQPLAAKPAEVFAGLPVDTVACFVPARQDAEYLRNPGDAPWREEGWALWHAPAKAEAFLSNLHHIQGGRALLILAAKDFVWTVSGEARATVLQWHPNTCTLTGLPVDPAAPPTFAAFFEGSPAHQRLRIFRLEAGNWKLVRYPASDKVRSGEAYWIQTDGGSRYQGPLRIELPAAGELDFDRQAGAHELTLVNDAPGTAARVRLETVREPSALTLKLVRREPQSLGTRSVALEGPFALPELATGQRTSVRLEPDRDAMRVGRSTTLLRISDTRGTLLWVPVSAHRDYAQSSR